MFTQDPPPPVPAALPAAAAGATEVTLAPDPVTAAAIEQVMRVCPDELLVLEVAACAPGSTRAAAALGRLLYRHPLRLLPGCPLIAWTSGTGLDPRWRDAYPASSVSLYAELEFLTELYAPAGSDDPAAPGTDAYARLTRLRDVAAADVG